jgi:GNAT superfamily N-acetyltransferase
MPSAGASSASTAERLASAAALSPSGLSLELLPPPSVMPPSVMPWEFSAPEALALHLYRQRLPGCNVDICLDSLSSPTYPGARGHSSGGRDDFLHLLVGGSGARTAVARRQSAAEATVVGACTFIPHASAAFCELQLLAVSRRFAGRGIGNALVSAVERWLRKAGVRVVVALAGVDMVEYWRKQGYTELRTTSSGSSAARGAPTLSSQHQALLRDPFGNSQAMLKAL